MARRIARQARAAETQFARQLRQVGTQISQLIRGTFNANNPDDPGWSQIEDLLRQYREMLRPWAGAVASRMLADVSRRDAAGWHSLGQTIGRALGREVADAPTADAMQQLYDTQVNLILELPDRATEKVRQSREISVDIVRQMKGPAEEAMTGGRRWETLVRDVHSAGLDIQSHAKTIARTETSRAATTFQMVRAKHIGSSGYIWRSSGDHEVRTRHRKLDGTFHRWEEPPVASELDQREMRYHPGQGPNCRCYPETVIPQLPGSV